MSENCKKDLNSNFTVNILEGNILSFKYDISINTIKIISLMRIEDINIFLVNAIELHLPDSILIYFELCVKNSSYASYNKSPVNSISYLMLKSKVNHGYYAINRKYSSIIYSQNLLYNMMKVISLQILSDVWLLKN